MGTPLCILQRERVDTVGALGPEPFPVPPCLRWAPACTLLPAGVSPAAGRGQPEWGWAGGVLLRTSTPIPAAGQCCRHCRLQCPAAPRGAPLARAGSCRWAGPKPWASCQHPRVLAALLPGGPAAVPWPSGSPRGPCSGTGLSQGLQGLADPPCLSHAVALPCPSGFPESGDWGRD